MRQPWRAPRIWDDFVIVIVGGGASFTAAQARLIGMARAKDLIRVIAINDAIYPCWFADIGYACDVDWWKYHGRLSGFPGLKIAIAQDGLPDWLEYLRNTGEEGFDPEPDALRHGQNGGHQAIHLAAHMGKRIMLVGFDVNGPHWFGKHPRSIMRTLPHTSGRLRLFGVLAGGLASRGVAVMNATPGSALKDFPRVDLESELTKLGAAHGKETASRKTG